MDISDANLAHRLKIKFGTAPSEPDQYQLKNIKEDILRLAEKGTTPSESDWLEIVRRHCPGAGSYAYKGADTSDLNTLLLLVTKK